LNILGLADIMNKPKETGGDFMKKITILFSGITIVIIILLVSVKYLGDFQDWNSVLSIKNLKIKQTKNYYNEPQIIQKMFPDKKFIRDGDKYKYYYKAKYEDVEYCDTYYIKKIISGTFIDPGKKRNISNCPTP